jgi:YD repeat-containing protein
MTLSQPSKSMLDKVKYYWAILVVLASALFVGNCRPKGGDDVTPIDSTALSSCVLLTEKINGILLRAYEYDSTRHLERVLEYSGSEQANKVIKRYSFEYDSKYKLLRLRVTNLAERDKSYIYELDYTTSAQLKTIRPFRVYNSGPRLEDSLGVTYGTNARITELKSKTGAVSKWEYDTAGNVKKWLIRTPLMKTDSIMAEYGSFDDKVNIYAFSEGMQLVNLLSGRAHSRRNPLTYTTAGQSVEASYQYNNKRVPTQAVLKFKSSNNTLRETVFSYELSCK